MPEGPIVSDVVTKKELSRCYERGCSGEQAYENVAIGECNNSVQLMYGKLGFENNDAPIPLFHEVMQGVNLGDGESILFHYFKDEDGAFWSMSIKDGSEFLATEVVHIDDWGGDGGTPQPSPKKREGRFGEVEGELMHALILLCGNQAGLMVIEPSSGESNEFNIRFKSEDHILSYNLGFDVEEEIDEALVDS